MFDIGFSELLVIAIVALIVIGPERLPRVARTLGHLFGRMQRYVNDVKADIAREMELEELRRLQSSVEDAARSIQSSVERDFNEAKSGLDELAAAADPAAQEQAGAPAAADPAAPAQSGGARQLDLALEAGAPPPAAKQG
ncbi:MAG: twin-arginine translocase subunit TatB [Burkholderiales bacterium]|nr:twin-arginine translocase subunit TatB [Burkholderiales bacterium]